MRRRVVVVPAVALAVVSFVGTVQAQEPTGPVAGTWGAEARGFFGASVLKFTSPASAWLLGGAGHYVTESSTGAVGSSSSDEHVSASVRLGYRRYRHADRPLRPYTTLSAIGQFYRQYSRVWGAGGAAEVGAAYFFSPHFSLGASGELHVLHMRRRSTSGGATATSRSLFVGTNGVQLLAAVYF